jgi:uncharacterized protein
MAVQYTNLSADCHLSPTLYPKDLWQSRLPARLREAGPKVVETDQGTMWSWEGELHGAAADGNDWAKHAKSHFRASRESGAAVYEVPEGKLGWEPEVMLPHMDLDGTWAAVYYADTRKEPFQEAELEIASYRAFNDWALEVSSLSPERVIILPCLPTSYPEACAEEIGRLAKKGARAVEFVLFDVAVPVLDEAWEPIWATAEEADIVLCSHVGDKKGVARPEFHRGARLAHYPQAPLTITPHLPKLIFSGVFDRHPKLRYSFAECRIGWLPFFISWMDRTAEQRPMQTDVKLSQMPSEYIRQQITFTFEEDYVGTRLLNDPFFFLQDCAVFGSDYPHEQGTWPNSDSKLDSMFEGVDPKIRQKVVWDRTAEFFKIKGPA